MLKVCIQNKILINFFCQIMYFVVKLKYGGRTMKIENLNLATIEDILKNIELILSKEVGNKADE